jgi:hypothetical protein
MDDKTRKHLGGALSLVALVLVAGGALARIQYATPYIAEYDGYYHIKMAQLFRENGFVGAFPWLPLTTFSDRFSDMHLLFHYLLVPFTFLGLMAGAKLYAVLSGTAVLLVLFLLLRREAVPWPFFWVLALLTSSGFLYRLALPRASQLSLLFLLAGLWLLGSGRTAGLFVLALLFTWTYTAFPMLWLLTFCSFVSVLFLEGRADARPLVSVTLGIAAGLVLNPYFPDNLWYYYTQVFEISARQKIPVGGEWYPWDTWYFLKENAVVLASLFLAVFFVLLQKGRKDVRTLTLFLAAAFFLFLSCKSRRFIEYFVPFGILFSAFALREPMQAALADRGGRKLSGALFLVLCLLVGAAAWNAVERTAREIEANARGTLNPFYEHCARWLEQNTPTDSRVFHTDWDDFPALFFFNTHNRYIAGIDPNFLYLRDPGLWRTYAEVTLGNVKNPAAVIRSAFGARWVFSDTLHDRFLSNLREEGRAVRVFGGPACEVYELPE